MIAYLDLPSGLSGDMLLGCLLDAGWSAERLRRSVQALPLPPAEWAIDVQQVMKGAIRATQVQVLFDEGKHQRRLADVTAIIGAATSLAPIVRDRAAAIFRRLAAAEARVHGTTADQIHFHEVGAVDAIIDIVANVSGLYELGVEQLFASPLPLGAGWTQTAHGRLPLPAPATIELLCAVNAPTVPAPGPGELVTPTGAAILAELATFEQPPMRLARLGIGAGYRDLAWPNVARLWLGEASAASASPSAGSASPTTAGVSPTAGSASPTAGSVSPMARSALVLLETNIDDMNPQWYAAACERLFAAGALDAWLSPVQMKKGRPGVVLSALAMAKDESALADLMLRHTTTLGVRVRMIDRRHEARREIRPVTTLFGEVRVKIKFIGAAPVDATPEYEDCASLARRAGVSLIAVSQAATVAAQALLSELGQTGAPSADTGVADSETLSE